MGPVKCGPARAGQGLYLSGGRGGGEGEWEGDYCFSGKRRTEGHNFSESCLSPKSTSHGFISPPSCPERPLQSWRSHGLCLPLPSVGGCSKEIVEIHTHTPCLPCPPPPTHTQHIPLGPQRKKLGAKGFHGQRIPRWEMKHRGPRLQILVQSKWGGLLL